MEIVERVKRSTGVFRELALEGLGQQPDGMAPLVRQAMKRTRARIRGNTRSESKLLSLFEPSTDVIRKGQAGEPNEFGKTVKLHEQRSGLSSIMGHAQRRNDAHLRLPAIESHQALLKCAAHFGGEPNWKSKLTRRRGTKMASRPATIDGVALSMT